MDKQTFTVPLTDKSGKKHVVRIEIMKDGWGRIYDADTYCGLVSPYSPKQFSKVQNAALEIKEKHGDPSAQTMVARVLPGTAELQFVVGANGQPRIFRNPEEARSTLYAADTKEPLIYLLEINMGVSL